MTLLQQYASWERWYSSIDQDAAARSTCSKCGLEGQSFYGFTNGGRRIAIAVCPRCGNETEF